MPAEMTIVQTRTPGASACARSGSLVFASAVAIDTSTMRRVPEADTIAAETRHCLASIEDSLGRAGCALGQVVKTALYVADESYFAEALATYCAHLGTHPLPSGTAVAMGLAGDCRVQIEVTAEIATLRP